MTPSSTTTSTPSATGQQLRQPRRHAAAFGLTATHFVAGLFISLFALFFFLYEGPRIWAWVVRLFPRTARDRVDSSAVIAWDQLSAFVRATMIVAFVDAVGIGVGAAILKVPFAFAIGILVFLLAFIPIVGALLSGFVAVVLALVAHGPGVALIMLAVVIGVQQLESHVLQPFLLGKAVSVHPLAVILAIAIGSITAGIVGALVAVPFAAVVNAVGKHLLIGESREELDDELGTGTSGWLPASPDHPPTKRPGRSASGRFVRLAGLAGDGATGEERPVVELVGLVGELRGVEDVGGDAVIGVAGLGLRLERVGRHRHGHGAPAAGRSLGCRSGGLHGHPSRLGGLHVEDAVVCRRVGRGDRRRLVRVAGGGRVTGRLVTLGRSRCSRVDVSAARRAARRPGG